jgi:hypothetical protein
MSGTLTLSQIRSSAQQRADMVNSQFLTTDEWNFNINQSLASLYDILVQKYGDDYFVAAPYILATNGTSFLYPLPTDFLKLLGVDLALSNTQDSFVTIRPFQFSDRNRYAVPNFQSFYGVTNLRYRLQGGNLWFTPVPSGGQTIRVWYIPRVTNLVLDTDTSDGFGGWLEYVIVDAAVKALAKEKTDTSQLELAKQQLVQRIESAAENRDAGNPQRVGDTQFSDMWWPTGSGSNSGGF